MRRISLIKILIILFFSLMFVSSCPNPVATKKEAEFIVSSTDKGMTDYGSPYIGITVTNIGNATGYDVFCKAEAINNNNAIICFAYAYFAGGGNINPGQSAQDDAVFFRLSSHSDYSYIYYELYWLNRD